MQTIVGARYVGSLAGVATRGDPLERMIQLMRTAYAALLREAGQIRSLALSVEQTGPVSDRFPKISIATFE